MRAVAEKLNAPIGNVGVTHERAGLRQTCSMLSIISHTNRTDDHGMSHPGKIKPRKVDVCGHANSHNRNYL